MNQPTSWLAVFFQENPKKTIYSAYKHGNQQLDVPPFCDKNIMRGFKNRLKKKKKRFAIDCCRKHDSKSQVNDWIQAL